VYILEVNNKRWLNLTIILVPILLGILIYVIFYPNTILFNNLLFQYFPELETTKNKLLHLAPELRLIPIKSIPTAFWAFSYTYTQAIILLRAKNLYMNKVLFTSNILIILLLELLQLEAIKLIPGTYDALDLISNVSAIFFALSLFFFLNKRKL